MDAFRTISGRDGYLKERGRFADAKRPLVFWKQIDRLIRFAISRNVRSSSRQLPCAYRVCSFNGQRFELADHAFDDIEAALPEVGIGDVDIRLGKDFHGGPGTTRL